MTHESLNVEVYRAAKEHAREKPGHSATVTLVQRHSYVAASDVARL